MQVTTTTSAASVTIQPVPVLDGLMNATAGALRRFTQVTGAGAFLIRGGAAFVDCWREPGAWTLRLGRLELVLDLKD